MGTRMSTGAEHDSDGSATTTDEPRSTAEDAWSELAVEMKREEVQELIQRFWAPQLAPLVGAFVSYCDCNAVRQAFRMGVKRAVADMSADPVGKYIRVNSFELTISRCVHRDHQGEYLRRIIHPLAKEIRASCIELSPQRASPKEIQKSLRQTKEFTNSLIRALLATMDQVPMCVRVLLGDFDEITGEKFPDARGMAVVVLFLLRSVVSELMSNDLPRGYRHMRSSIIVAQTLQNWALGALYSKEPERFPLNDVLESEENTLALQRLKHELPVHVRGGSSEREVDEYNAPQLAEDGVLACSSKASQCISHSPYDVLAILDQEIQERGTRQDMELLLPLIELPVLDRMQLRTSSARGEATSGEDSNEVGK